MQSLRHHRRIGRRASVRDTHSACNSDLTGICNELHNPGGSSSSSVVLSYCDAKLWVETPSHKSEPQCLRTPQSKCSIVEAASDKSRPDGRCQQGLLALLQMRHQATNLHF